MKDHVTPRSLGVAEVFLVSERLFYFSTVHSYFSFYNFVNLHHPSLSSKTTRVYYSQKIDQRQMKFLSFRPPLQARYPCVPSHAVSVYCSPCTVSRNLTGSHYPFKESHAPFAFPWTSGPQRIVSNVQI